MKARNIRIDFLKGVMMLLVVLIHVTLLGEWYPYVKEIILTFVNALFVFVSAYLFNADKPVGKFLSYLLWIFVPYVLMVSGYTVVSSFVPAVDSVETLTADAVLRNILISPPGPYWYLKTLLLCSSVWYLVRRVAGNRLGYVSLHLLLAFALLALAMVPDTVSFGSAVYYILGVALRSSGKSMDSVLRPHWMPLSLFAALVCFPSNRSCLTVAGLAVTACFVSGMFWTCDNGASGVRRLFAFVGKNTLPIYLFHPVFTMLAKKFQTCFLVVDSSGVSFIFVTVIFAAAGSIGLAWVMDKIKVSRWFCGRNLFVN